MKRLFIAALSVLSSIAFGATTVPVQLLNPTGSSSGQAIISTGASSAPAWGGIGLNSISAIAANTVIGNATGSSAVPTAITVTGCNGAAQALQWTNGSGFGCNSAIATSGANTNITSLSSPTITTPTVTGFTNGVAVGAGVQGQTASQGATGVSLTTGTAANVTSFTLQAGFWMIGGNIQFTGSASPTAFAGGINSMSATLPATPNLSQITYGTGSFPAGNTINFVLPVTLVAITTPTTYFVVGLCNFSSGTCTGGGQIWAIRYH